MRTQVAVLMRVLDPMSMRLFGMVPALIVTRMKNCRYRVQMLIAGLASFRNHRQAAAGIAGLVGNCSIQEARDLALALKSA